MSAHPFELAGTTAVVTGARRGIGRAAAVALARAGADIVGVSASLGPGDQVAADVAALGQAFRPYRCDLADRRAVHALAAQLASDLPRVDVLVLSAGTIERRPAVDHGDELWDRVLEVNLSAQFVLARELGRKMVERRSGKVIFVASMLSFQGGVTVPGYAASKGGIAQLTKALANEWAPHGVNVNAVAPGYVATDNTEALRNDETRARQILERIPAGRWGEPEDMAGAFVFLASPASDYVHGIVLPVDGGWLAR
ncbi:MAG TPA: SDR family oxidoreductase [Gaiellaceae bacterium]|nr:SDR family oxidoreductase [Gaiellaceae bacterium]